MPAWTDSERSKMFLAMIELMAPPGSSNKLPSWTMVAERMGSGFTGEAVRQQFQKCRKEGLPRQVPPRNRPLTSKRHRALNTTFTTCEPPRDDDESQFLNGKKIKMEDKAMMGRLASLPNVSALGHIQANPFMNNGYLPPPPAVPGPSLIKTEPLDPQMQFHDELDHLHQQLQNKNGNMLGIPAQGGADGDGDDDDNVPLVQQRNTNPRTGEVLSRVGGV